MHQRIKKKWRPSLALVIGGTLAAVMTAPMAGLLLVRVLSDQIRFRYSALLVGVLVLLITLVLGWLLWRLILRPVQALVARSESMKDGLIIGPLEHYGTRELQELGQSVLEMGTVLHNRQKSVATYTNHVTHELKSPLTALVGAAELLDSDQLTGKQRSQLLGTVRQSAERMQALLEGLREMAHAREPLGLGQGLLKNVLDQIGTEYSMLELQVEGGGVPLPIPPQGLEVILRQMLGNAAEYGATKVQLIATSDPETLTIRDNGKGISEGNRAHLFEPFFTTRREEGGTGMGLAIVRSLLEVRGAEIDVLDGDQGAVFQIRF